MIVHSVLQVENMNNTKVFQYAFSHPTSFYQSEHNIKQSTSESVLRDVHKTT